MDSGATELAHYRISTPSDDYAATIAAIRNLTAKLIQGITSETKIGIGVPGSISPVSRLIQNANSRWLNGHPLDVDLEVALGLPVRLANDANCFALSEAIDGAAEKAHTVFGAILGTGCGGGIVVDGRLLNGPRSIAGEWGHNPLPWATADEYPGPQCWCGRKGCLETWLSGPGMAADHTRTTGETLTPLEISARAKQGNKPARATLTRHVHRLAIFSKLVGCYPKGLMVSCILMWMFFRHGLLLTNSLRHGCLGARPSSSTTMEFATCPGVKKAVDNFIADSPDFKLFHLLTGQALLFRT